MKTYSQLSMITLGVGILLTVGVSIITFRWPQSQEVTSALIVGLIGIAITLAFELRVKMKEIEELVAEGIAETGKAQKILENSRKDEFFSRRYEEIKQEINDLASGKYRIWSLNALYHDDIRSINSLRSGERLLSTCPVSTISKESALQQLSEPHYTASIKAHLAAAQRGVQVTRLYLFKDREIFNQPQLQTHLSNLTQAGIEIRILFRDKLRLDVDLDFLVFGDRKVSVGEIDPDTGTVKGAYVYTDRKTVEKYVGEYEKIIRVVPSLEEVLGESS